MYSTRNVYEITRQTGGIKRFIELTEYVCKTRPKSILISRDNNHVVRSHDINNFVKLNERPNNGRLLPPEVSLFLSNIPIIRQIKKKSCDVVVIFDTPTAIGPILSGLQNVILMIRKDMIGYEMVQNQSKLKWLKIFLQWICESVCMYKSKRIITQCVYDKEVLKKRHPLFKNVIERKTIVQINNANPSWIVSKSLKNGQQVLEINPDGFRVCFIGGFGNPRKGQDLFLDAALEVLKCNDNVEFILIGGGNRLEEYKQRYANDHIKFLGSLENPLPTLKTCDLLVVPSYADSCPNTVMEALYNSIPVIGSRAGGIPEILLDEESLFDLQYQSLTERILYFIHNPSSLVALKERQKRRKEELTFDWAERIVEIIEEP